MIKRIFVFALTLLLCLGLFPAAAAASSVVDVRVVASPDALVKDGFVDLHVSISIAQGGADILRARLYLTGADSPVAEWQRITAGQTMEQMVPDIYVNALQIGTTIPMELRYIDAAGREGTIPTGFFVLEGVASSANSNEAKVSFARTSSASSAELGSRINLTYTVRNDGGVALTNLVITDDLVGPVGVIESLAPGARGEFVASAVIGENSVSVPRLTYTNGYTGQTSTNVLEPLEIPVSLPKLSVMLKADVTAIRAGDAVTLTYTVLNEGNVTFYDLQLSDEQAGQVPGTEKLEPGESYVYTKKEKLVMSADYSFSVMTRDADNRTFSAQSNAVSIVVTDASTAAPQSGVLSISATTDITTLSEPGKVRFVITVNNASAEPVVGMVLSEAAAGVIERMEILPTGDKVFYHEVEITARTAVAYTVEGRLGSEQGARVQAITQPVTVDFITPSPVSPNPWDGLETPQPTTMESVVEPMPIPGKSGPGWLLGALIVIGVLILICVIALVGVYRRDQAARSYAAMPGGNVARPAPRPRPVAPPTPARPVREEDEVTQPVRGRQASDEDVPTRPLDPR